MAVGGVASCWVWNGGSGMVFQGLKISCEPVFVRQRLERVAGSKRCGIQSPTCKKTGFKIEWRCRMSSVVTCPTVNVLERFLSTYSLARAKRHSVTDCETRSMATKSRVQNHFENFHTCAVAKCTFIREDETKLACPQSELRKEQNDCHLLQHGHGDAIVQHVNRRGRSSALNCHQVAALRMRIKARENGCCKQLRQGRQLDAAVQHADCNCGGVASCHKVPAMRTKNVFSGREQMQKDGHAGCCRRSLTAGCVSQLPAPRDDPTAPPLQWYRAFASSSVC